MKMHKALGLSGLYAEKTQATVDIGTQWMLDLCNGIVLQCFDAVGRVAGKASGL